MVYTPACTTLNQNVHMKREKEKEEEEKEEEEEEEGNKEEQEEEEEEEKEEKSAMIFLGTLSTQKPPLRHLDQPVREHEIM